MTSTDTADKTIMPTSIPHQSAVVYAVLVVQLLIILAASYFFWRQLILRDHGLREFQDKIESAERSQDRFLQQNREEQHALQAMLQDQLAQFDSRMEKLSSTDRSDWLLAETEYLLRMANQYALLAHDARSAEALLANADEVLQELEKNSVAGKQVVNIRSQIAHERAALKLRSELDKEGLYLRLEALIRQVDQIAVVDVSSMSKKDRSAEHETVSYEPSISKRMVASLLRALEKIGAYIRVQHHDQDIGPLLSPDEQQYLKQNLRFRLEQAQIALLQQHQAVYENSLRDARDWVKKYYVIEPELKIKILAELDADSKYNVEDPLPDISVSLVALKSYMQTRHVFHDKPRNK